MEQNYKKEIMNIKGKREYKEQNINAVLQNKYEQELTLAALG